MQAAKSGTRLGDYRALWIQGGALAASLAAEVNAGVENIGARRLHTTMERLLEDASFSAADRSGATVVFDAAAVEKTLGDLARGADLGKFIP